MEKERLPAATSLYGAIADVGLAAGPALAALVLVAGGPEEVLLPANAATFAISGLGLLTIDFGRAPNRDAGEELSLFADTRAGVRATRGIPGLRTLLPATGGALFFGGLLNVAELPFVTSDLGGSEAAYSFVVALAGLGVAAGSLSGGAGGAPTHLRDRFLFGMILMAGGLPGIGARGPLGAPPDHLRDRRLRQRRDARARAADAPRAGARSAGCSGVRHPGRHHGVGVRHLVHRGGRHWRVPSGPAR